MDGLPENPPQPAYEQPAIVAEPATAPAKPRRRVGAIIAIILLSLALATAATFIVLYVLQLNDANDLIDKQDKQITEQQELIDKKETFGAAMNSLLDDASQLEGVLTADVVPVDSYQLTASRAYTHRWDADKLDNDIADVAEHAAALAEKIEGASAAAASNATGSQYEATIDALGRGYVTSLLYEADSFCETDVLACVDSADPYTVHFDSADDSLEYMTDFIRTGIAYHEFAHVLQMTNPEATDEALDAFGGDEETMADCYALAYLDGWKLDHRVWVSSYRYWDVSIGYGYTCDDSQRQVIIDWYEKLGYHPEPISQER